MKKDLAIFEGNEIRRSYDEKTETWFFSVVDIIRVLTQQPDFQASRKYWKVLKGRLKKRGQRVGNKLLPTEIARRRRQELPHRRRHRRDSKGRGMRKSTPTIHPRPSRASQSEAVNEARPPSRRSLLQPSLSGDL